MVAAKSVPQNRRRSSNNDPFDAFLRPPPDETPAQREMRILAEQQAKQVSDAIDEQLRVERTELKRNRPDVKILLLGQSESGKSTTLKRRCSHQSSFWARNGRIYVYVSDVRVHPPKAVPAGIHSSCSCAYIPTLTHFAEFQLLHTPAAFQAERIAWRTVIYLNLVRSVRRCVFPDHMSCTRTAHCLAESSIPYPRSARRIYLRLPLLLATGLLLPPPQYQLTPKSTVSPPRSMPNTAPY